MESLYVTFKVEVSNTEYLYQGQRGDAEMKLQVPRSMLENLDPSQLFSGILMAALTNYDKPDEEVED